MSHTNVEIKARVLNQERIRDLLLEKNAKFQGTDYQIDTYFRTESGRLKLREGEIENNLIYYEREDKPGIKESNVILFKTNPDKKLKEILEKVLGVLVIVDKVREIFWIENIKFHLDKVKGLGTFVEIEAVDYDGKIGKEKLRAQCKEYLDLFEIPEEDLVSCSYSDLLAD